MTEVFGVNNLDEVQAFLNGQRERAESLTLAWQRELKEGDYVVGIVGQVDPQYIN